MATFDQHSKCACCHDKGLGSDPCVLKTGCQYCKILTSDQKYHIIMSTYKARKEKKATSLSSSLVDHGSVQILGQVETSKNLENAATSKKTKTLLNVLRRNYLSSCPVLPPIVILRHWMRSRRKDSPD